MPSPRPIQWNDWARPAYAGSPLYTKVDNVNLKGFDFKLPSIIPEDFRRLGFEPLDVFDDPSKWSKLRQLEELGKGASFGGNLLDELYRGNAKNDPDWKVAGMPDLPGIGGLKKTKTVIDAARKARAATATEKVVKDIVAQSKTPVPLAPASGVSPVAPIRNLDPITPLGKRKFVVRNGELVEVPAPRTDAPSISMDVLPDSRRMTEGPVKRDFLEPATEMVSRPSLAYERQQVNAIKNRLFPPSLKALPESTPGRLPDLPPIQAGGAVRGPTDLPPIDLESLTPPAPKPNKLDYLLGGRRAPIVPNATSNTGASGQKFTRQIWDEMAADSPAGQKMSEIMQTTRLEGDNLAGTWKAASRAIRAPIEKDPERWGAFVKALDTGEALPPHLANDADLQKAVAWHRRMFKTTGEQATASGMGFRTKDGTKIIPFEGRDNYFPHIYPKEFFENVDNAAAAMSSKYGMSLDDARATVMRAQQHGGMLIPETETARAAMAKYGERYINPQHSRELVDFQGWRTDPGAIDTHLTNMAHRITESKNFGAMDIGAKGTPLSNLLDQTNNKDLIRNLAERVLKREAPPGYIGSRAAKAASTVAKGMAATHLSLFPISNTQQLAAIPLRAGIVPTAKAIGRKFTDRAGVKLRAYRGGALEAADTDALQEMGGRSGINKAYGISRSEKTVRSIANEAGQIHVQDLFRELKKNPTSDKIRNKIEELTRTPANELLAQETLTQKQVNLAGGRMAEITQGRAMAGDLPYNWSNGPGSNLIVMFKKYGYRQAHTMANAIKENPAKNIPLALFGFGMAGEAAGDIKAGIRGTVKGMLTAKDLAGAPAHVVQSAWDEIKKRGDWIKKDNPMLSRIIDNYTQAWLLGLPGDAIQAISKNKSAITELVAGPAIGFGSEVLYGAGQAALGDLEPLAQTAARRIPFVGSGIAATLKGEKKKPTGKVRRRR